jgi:type IV pilus assembly protein PilM
MNLLSSDIDFFGLDVGSTAARVVQLKGGGANKVLVKYAYVPIDSKIALSDSPADQQKLAQAVSELIKQARLSTRNVAVGIPSNRVFTTIADVDRLSRGELEKAIPYQADSLIPTPMSESKIDWELLGDSPVDKTKLEIILTSVPNKFVESRLDMLEGIGLNVVAFEPDNLALARSMSSNDVNSGPELILDIGNVSSDLVINMGGSPHLTRNIPTGMEAIIKAATQNLSIDEKQATQFVLKFGLSKDKLEGQIYDAISNTVEMITSEIEKSIKFFMTRYSSKKVEKIIVTGGAATVPELPLFLANKFSISVEIGNSWRNVSYSADRQNELLSISNQFGVAVGLAERSAM